MAGTANISGADQMIVSMIFAAILFLKIVVSVLVVCQD